MLFSKQLLQKLKSSTHSKEAYFEAILYEILHGTSNDNIEESVREISGILHNYPYMSTNFKARINKNVKY